MKRRLPATKENRRRWPVFHPQVTPIWRTECQAPSSMNQMAAWYLSLKLR